MDILSAAREWSVPPWVVEQECSPLWWERWKILREETARAQKDAADKAAGGE